MLQGYVGVLLESWYYGPISGPGSTQMDCEEWWPGLAATSCKHPHHSVPEASTFKFPSAGGGSSYAGAFGRHYRGMLWHQWSRVALFDGVVDGGGRSAQTPAPGAVNTQESDPGFSPALAGSLASMVETAGWGPPETSWALLPPRGQGVYPVRGAGCNPAMLRQAGRQWGAANELLLEEAFAQGGPHAADGLDILLFVGRLARAFQAGQRCNHGAALLISKVWRLPPFQSYCTRSHVSATGVRYLGADHAVGCEWRSEWRLARSRRRLQYPGTTTWSGVSRWQHWIWPGALQWAKSCVKRQPREGKPPMVQRRFDPCPTNCRANNCHPSCVTGSFCVGHGRATGAPAMRVPVGQLTDVRWCSRVAVFAGGSTKLWFAETVELFWSQAHLLFPRRSRRHRFLPQEQLVSLHLPRKSGRRRRKKSVWRSPLSVQVHPRWRRHLLRRGRDPSRLNLQGDLPIQRNHREIQLLRLMTLILDTLQVRGDMTGWPRSMEKQQSPQRWSTNQWGKARCFWRDSLLRRRSMPFQRPIFRWCAFLNPPSHGVGFLYLGPWWFTWAPRGQLAGRSSGRTYGLFSATQCWQATPPLCTVWRDVIEPHRLRYWQGLHSLAARWMRVRNGFRPRGTCSSTRSLGTEAWAPGSSPLWGILCQCWRATWRHRAANYIFALTERRYACTSKGAPKRATDCLTRWSLLTWGRP